MKSDDSTRQNQQPNASSSADEFARQAEAESVGIVAEFYDFLITNKRWWLAPIVIVLLLLGLLIILHSTPLGSFMYTLF